jgi:hypothetical protein
LLPVRTPLSREILSAHEEIEELLEAYLMDCNALSSKLAYLLVTMQNAEDLVSKREREGERGNE